jgi:hypothetical protein
MVKSASSPTGYRLVSWEPLKPMAPQNVAEDNRDAINRQKSGQTVALNISGERVEMKKIGIGRFTVEGSDREYDLQGAYRQALKVAEEKRGKKKPKTAAAPKAAPAPLTPPGRPDLDFLSWDPSKKSEPEEPTNVAVLPKKPTQDNQSS